MITGNALILMFLKDLKTFYRKWISLVVQILILLIFVPLIWYGSYQANKAITGVNGTVKNDFILQQMQQSSNFNPAKVPLKLEIKNVGNVDDAFVDSLISAVQSICDIDPPSPLPEVIIKISEISISSPKFVYELVLVKTGYNSTPYHNEPYTISNVFGDNSGKINLGIPFSQSREAAAAQFCIDEAFISAVFHNNNGSNRRETLVNAAVRTSKIETTSKSFVILFSIIFPLVMLIPMMISSVDICAEKESGIHKYMIVMGLPRFVFNLSHLLFALIKMYFFVILAGTALIVFIPTVGCFTFLLIFLLGHVFLGIVMLFSTFFKSSLYVILSSLASIIAYVAIHFAVEQYVDIYNSLIAAVLCVFNPMSGYAFGIRHLLIMLDYSQPMSFFNSWNSYLPFSVPVFSLIIHIIFLLLLAFYCDYVVPTDDSQKKHPLFIFGMKYDAEKIEENDVQKNRENTVSSTMESSTIMGSDSAKFAAYIEADSGNRKPAIEVSKLVKKWSNGDVAVNGVSFRAYKDQVTALLGPNGAGKSTIFGVITGCVMPTSGVVQVEGESSQAIGEESNVGFCPQWNPVFPFISVEEHLRFYGDLKTGSSVTTEEVEEILQKIGLFDDKQLYGNQLSGGMKRKLCVGIALIGGSKVLLLDEPTAGIDTLARRTMIEIIEKAKEGRTVLLTTHYMDEADLLSDRIIIMSKGEVICNGSSEFLKARFGVGFELCIDLNPVSMAGNASPDYNKWAVEILNIAIENCNGAKIDGPIAQQFNIILPYGSQRSFPKLFKELENRQESLKIESFDIRVNSLEQVFIKVNDYADSTNSDDIHAKIKEFIKNKGTQTSSCGGTFFSQVLGLFIRKLWYAAHHYIRTTIPFALVIVLLILLILNATQSTSKVSSQSDFYQKTEKLDLSTYPDLKVILGYSASRGTFLQKLIKNASNVKLIEQMSSTHTSVLQTCFQHSYEIPSFSFGIGLEGESKNFIFWKETFPNGVPLALNLLSNSRFGNLTPIKTSISIAPNDSPYIGDVKSTYKSPINFVIVFIFPFVFIFPVLLHVTEIHHGPLHLYQRTSMWTFTYWFSAYTSDFLLSFIPIGLATIMIFSFGLLKIVCFPTFCIAVIVMSFAFLSQAYAVSYMFKNATSAVVLLIIYNFILFAIIMVILMVIAMFITFDLSGIAKIFFPTASLYSILENLINNCGKDNVNFLNTFTSCKIIDDSATLCMGYALWIELGITFLSGIFYSLILLLMSYWSVITKFIKCAPPSLPELSHEDADILHERERVDRKGINEFAVCTQGLRRNFSGGKIAVQNLTLGISHGECFGLLGANGAGKSTTFNMLTANIRPTSGHAFVNGVDIEDRPQFGFCPQKDAVLEDLSIQQTLKLFSRLNGVSDTVATVEALLECVHLSHKKNNLAKNCSGGELRRLSVAVALITNSDVLMLDEPTAGVDPRTRRHIWEILLALRTSGTSQILTSHSMEECETLCTRIGFLNKGQLVAIGTSQRLKHRYGNTYMLSITMHGIDEPLAARLNIDVKKEFEGSIPILLTRSIPTLSWTLPKTSTPLSEMYEHLIEFIDRQPRTIPSQPAIKDFALVGTSLDEVFVTMVKENIAVPPQ